MKKRYQAPPSYKKNVSQEIMQKKLKSEQVFPLETDIKISNCTISI